MLWLNNLVGGVRSLFEKKRVERELDEELEGFLEASAKHKRESGMGAEAARRAALVEVGSRSVVKHQVWASRWESSVDGFFQDLRVSLRSLAKSPGYTAVALLSLALGIGGNTAIFTLIDQVLLRELPVRAPKQLVSFGTAMSGGLLGGVDEGLFSLFDYEFARRLGKDPGPFQGVAAYDSNIPKANVRTNGADDSQPALQTSGNLVTGNYFSVLGADALLGRTLQDSDMTAPGANAVVVVSYRFWQEALSGDRAALGRVISINGTPLSVVGVMPEAFHGIQQTLDPPEFWAPLTMQPQLSREARVLEPRSAYFLHIVAREQAHANRAAEQQWLDRQIRNYVREGEGATITADRQQEIERETTPLVEAAHGVSALRFLYGNSLELLMGVVAVVLLIACANLANFVLARAAMRQREIATRLALGSSRGRIVRQGLVETFLLSLTGGAIGLGLAFVATRALIAFVAQGNSYTPLSATPNAMVLLFTLGISVGTGMLFGLAPALTATRGAATERLSSSARGPQGGSERTSRVWPKTLVAAQVMLSLLLLVGAGLLLRTLENLQSQEMGFERTHLLLAEFDATAAGYKSNAVGGLHQRMLERLGAIPGVRSAALSLTGPVSRGGWSSSLTIPGYVTAPKEDMSSMLNRVSGGYFETVGISMVAGRPLTPEDNATSLKVAVINEVIARKFFPKGDALGRSIGINGGSVEGPWQIVGVARDSKTLGPRATAPVRMMYIPLAQIPAMTSGPNGPESNGDSFADTIELRTVGDPSATIRDLRRTMTTIDPNLPLLKVRTIGEEVDGMVSDQALISRLTGIFSLLAVTLAGIGLYGVMSYNVIRRTSEIGIRLALGAQIESVRWMVLRESLGLLGIGIGLGLPLTFAATTLIRKQLFGLSAVDPATFLVAIGVVAGMTLLAGWLPARRATRVDPMVALRCD